MPLKKRPCPLCILLTQASALDPFRSPHGLGTLGLQAQSHVKYRATGLQDWGLVEQINLMATVLNVWKGYSNLQYMYIYIYT